MGTETRLPEFFKGPNLRIGVIGCGYVGLPLILRYADLGHSVWGFDTDPAKVEKLNAGQSYLRHIPAGEIKRHVDARKFVATSDFSKLQGVDAVLICVPTPLDERKEPDLSYVEQTALSISGNLRKGQLVVLESTTYPGTTEELVLPILERSGLRCCLTGDAGCGDAGGDFFLAFSPEREDPGNKQFNVGSIPKIIGGVNPPSRRAAEYLYSQIVPKVITVSSTRAAEMTKLLENIFRCVNIALVNELKMLCLRMGLDIWEVIDAASTKPFGFMPFYPGPGLGGHCIPLDPFYLSWKAREFDFATRFIELAGEINTNMPYLVVDAIGDALNRSEKSVRGAKVLVLGVAYKKDVDDTRESPALKIIDLLVKRGARVQYNDPYTPALHKTRHYDFSYMQSLALTGESLANHDCAVIATDHSAYDYQMIVDHSQVVVDTRNATRKVTRNREKIVLC